jgi:hypothetical protein
MGFHPRWEIQLCWCGEVGVQPGSDIIDPVIDLLIDLVTDLVKLCSYFFPAGAETTY